MNIRSINKPYFVDRTTKKRPASYSIANLKTIEKSNNSKDHIHTNFEKNSQDIIGKKVS